MPAFLQLLPQRRVREGRVQMPVDEHRSGGLRDDVALECPLVDLRQGVVQALAVAQGLVDRRVEPVQETQLELVRTLEQVLELRERQRDLRRLVHGLGCQPVMLDRRRGGRYPLLRSDVIEEARTLPLLLVARHRRERRVEILLRSRHGDV